MALPNPPIPVFNTARHARARAPRISSAPPTREASGMIGMESLRMKGVTTSVGNRLSRGRFFTGRKGQPFSGGENSLVYFRWACFSWARTRSRFLVIGSTKPLPPAAQASSTVSQGAEMTMLE